MSKLLPGEGVVWRTLCGRCLAIRDSIDQTRSLRCEYCGAYKTIREKRSSTDGAWVHGPTPQIELEG